MLFRKAASVFWAVAIVAFVLTAVYVRADEDYYRLRLGEKMLNTYVISPRALGMGGAYAALNEGAHGTYMNPATLGAENSHEVLNVFSYDRITEAGKDANFTTLTLAGGFNFNNYKPDYFPVEDGVKTAGVSFSHIGGSTGGFDGFQSGASRINLGYGRSFNYGRVMAGTSVGFLSNHMGDNDGYDSDIQAYTLRAGVIVRVSQEFSIGGVAAVGSGDTEDKASNYLSSGTYLERELRIGASWQLREDWLVAADLASQKFERDSSTSTLSGEGETHDILKFSFGSEYVIVPKQLTVRGGFFIKNDDYKTSESGYNSADQTWAGLTGGCSYFRDNWTVGTDHQLSTNGDHSHYLNFMLTY